MHDVFHRNVPADLGKLFTKIEKHKNKSKYCLNMIRPQREIGRTSISYRGPFSLNVLPSHTKECLTREVFERKLKKHKLLIDNISYRKEAAVETNKNSDFNYFKLDVIL